MVGTACQLFLAACDDDPAAAAEPLWQQACQLGVVVDVIQQQKDFVLLHELRQQVQQLCVVACWLLHAQTLQQL